jgi:hypothetical protein
MQGPSGERRRRRRVRYTVRGKTAFFVAESSSGFVAGVGELAPEAARRFHLTSIKGEKRFESHITDQKGETPRMRIHVTPNAKTIRRLKRLAPFVHRYRWNEVVWLPLSPMEERLDAINRPERVDGRDVIPLERLRQRITIILWDPNLFRKVRLSELAATGKVGYRYVGQVLHLVLASKDGAALVLPSRRVRGLIKLVLDAGGLGFGEYLAHIDRHWPDEGGSRHGRV